MNLEAVVDPESTVDDYGFPAGAELLRFATAANRAANPISVQHLKQIDLITELDEARRGLVEVLGREALVEAAATVAAFNGLVRVADGTGIELDDGLNRASVDVRSDLKLNELAGATNTHRLEVGSDQKVEREPAGTAIESLFMAPNRQ